MVEIGIDLEAHAAAVAGALVGLLHRRLGEKIVGTCARYHAARPRWNANDGGHLFFERP
jgi:hypothetical protein